MQHVASHLDGLADLGLGNTRGAFFRVRADGSRF